jgi:hypothetical protein
MEGQNVKAQTAVHLVDGTVLETDHSFEYMARLLGSSRNVLQSLTVVDGHGRVTRAFVSIPAIIAVRELRGAPAGALKAA